ncbi:FHA domain-containing protein [Rathayibacter sp. VKM Ac-2759]|uniref:RDD family protein n=2 Tax=Rathayibacter TaxID=33886 RepID=UPI001318E8F6|nr:RDD family protein [Rathayibacter sp. VKM Ac-2759]QHC66058.1 FHA domain-containing protein [Rathayibacter sp. VKM Ac-2759]
MPDTTTAGWVCTRCSTSMEASAAFCRGCGAPAASGAAQAARARIGVPATLGRRFGAYLIDMGIATAIGLLVGSVIALVAGSMLAGAAYDAYYSVIVYGSIAQNVVALGYGIYYVASVGGRGSPGMRLLGLRLVMYTTEEAPGFWRVVARNIVLSLTALIIVGPFSPLFDKTGRNRGWHDQATDTWMLDIRSAGGARPASTVREAPAPTSSVAVVASELEAPALPHTPGSPALPHTPPAPGGHSAPAVAAASFTAPPAAGVISAVPGSAAPARAHEPEDLELTRMSVGAPAPQRTRAVRLRFDDGTVVVVSDTALVGRNPAPRTGEAAGELVALADTTRSISKTHARLEFTGDELSVIDRHSTNGTAVVVDGTATPVPPGGRAPVPVGATLTFGDRTATVEWA